jgi:hypothetical protein
MLPAVRPIALGRIRILPPPWSSATPAARDDSRDDAREHPRDHLHDHYRDPLRVLADAGDRLGIDRRARARDGDPRLDPDAGDGRLTAAGHRPCPVVFALADRGRWALVKGLSRAPQGLLVSLLDPLDKELDARDRIGVLGLRALARVAGPRGRPASPLLLVSSCVQAPALVDTLGRRTTTGGARSIELVPLFVRTGDGWQEIDTSHRWAGELTPLCDPRPGVLAVAVSPDALAALDALLTPRPPRAAPAPKPARARRGRKSKRSA